MKPEPTHHAMQPMNWKFAAPLMVTVALTWLAAPASAGIVYQETFDTDTPDLLTMYAFSIAGNALDASKYTAVGGQALADYSIWNWPGGDGYLSATPGGFTYDWSSPLTVSGDLRSTANTGYQNLGVYAGTSTGALTVGHEIYYATPGDMGGWLNFPGGGRLNYSRNNATAIPFGDTNMHVVSLQIRQNSLDSAKFDVCPQLDGVNQITGATTFGGNFGSAFTVSDGWIMGLSKATFLGANSIQSVGYDLGVNGTVHMDNLTLAVAADATILRFGLPGVPAAINGTNITWTVPDNLGLDLAAQFTLSPGATCYDADPDAGGNVIASGTTTRNFTNPVHYWIRSADGLITNDYTVTVTQVPVSSEKNILSFAVAPGLPPAVIGVDTITATVPLGFNLAALAPTYTASPWASGSPASGTTVDFTTPQVYTITAQNGSTKNFTVSVVTDAIPLYQETFDTDTAVLESAYGLSASNLTTGSVSGGVAAMGGSNFYLWATVAEAYYTYNWSAPLTMSADVGATNGGIGPVMGIFLANAAAAPSSANLAYLVYWPMPGDWGAYIADHNFDPRILHSPTTMINATSELHNLAMTIRGNAGNSALFDLLVQIDGVNQVTGSSTLNFGGSNPDAYNGNDGWIYGLSKAGYGINGTSALKFGMRNEGTPGALFLDNLTLTLGDSTPPQDPYGTWLTHYPDLTGNGALPDADPDGDGLTNQQEFAFGLDPTSGASATPITEPLDPDGFTFTYTRLAASGLDYTVWTSTDLVIWDGPAAVRESVLGTVDGVERVEVTLTSPPASDKLFVRVGAQ